MLLLCHEKMKDVSSVGESGGKWEMGNDLLIARARRAIRTAELRLNEAESREADKAKWQGKMDDVE